MNLSKSTAAINKKKSPIWDHYALVNSEKAKCKICKHILSYKTSTTNLRKHYSHKHPSVKLNNHNTNDECVVIETSQQQNQTVTCSTETEDTNESFSVVTNNDNNDNANVINVETAGKSGNGVKKQTSMTHYIPKKISNSYRQKIDDALLKLFIYDYQPFSIVEDKGFKEMINILCPTYRLPDRRIISRTMIPAQYEKALIDVHEYCKEITKCCLTTDCWTSRNNESFIGVTVHFINKEFELKSVLLGCRQFDENHTSVNLAHQIKMLTDKFGLSNKIVLTISDNAANIKTAIIQVLQWKHLGCLAHTINLIVQDAIQIIFEITEKVRRIVTIFRRSSTAQSKLMLFQKNSGNTPKKLSIDVVTRWNSTYYMLERFLELKDAIKSTIALLDKDLPIISCDEWITIEQVIIILKPYEQITTLLSAQKYVTGSLVIVLVNGLKNVIEKISGNVANFKNIKEFCLVLQRGMDNRLQNLEKSKTLIAATMLDPRFKSVSFQSTLTGAAGKEAILNALCFKFSTLHEQQILSAHRDEIRIEDDNNNNMDIWSFHDSKAAEFRPVHGTARSKAIIEFNRYMDEDLLKRKQNPLKWWKTNKHNYPNLSEVVRDIFCIIGTSVPCERLFSKAGLILNDRRCRLHAEKVEQLLFLNINKKLFE